MNLIDLHCDTIYRICNNQTASLKKNSFHVDLEKLQQANSWAQFFALFIDYKEEAIYGENPFEHTLGMLDRFYQEVEANDELVAIAKNYQDLKANQQENKISAFLTIEEGGVLEGQLSRLRNFYRLGVRLITLTWNYPNQLGYSNSKLQYRQQGLTPFGRQVVKEMNKLGMLIDVSHLSDQGFYDVAQLSSQPFIASHSNARELRDHHRNLTDKMIRIIAKQGGVIGLNFAASFLGDNKISKVEDIVRHIKHIRNVGGSEVIALGSDFDGIDCELEISNIAKIDKLITTLKKNQFTTEEIEKIFFKNAERVIKEVL
ncbi:Zn-dependent dipeptidase, microsomal dipeptidase [Halobacteroides halobius DSM 5150]|uniref:Zn-dependent dipeptidase, microsomal dipeptidase n=1 Tax=Halobacteroides halobius (strain ATCC 35273 / DSM 5150 / MD-1) TaxID=748449 RepID=L0KBC4_HALHC|nr:dipeptidase [Halobacteroides halobius]AGB41383.1 Zn-dependent dipeptidase, microsomal dipeptidase [Halobacteroides halobius DSM 5150]